MGKIEKYWDKEYPKPNPFENARKPDPKVMSEAGKKAMKKRMDNGEVPFNLTPDQEKKREAGKAKHVARQRKAREEKAAAAAAAQMQYENRRDETGGYQSSFGQDTGFMEGSGTSKDMGSFKDGGLVSMFVEKK